MLSAAIAICQKPERTGLVSRTAHSRSPPCNASHPSSPHKTKNHSVRSAISTSSEPPRALRARATICKTQRKNSTPCPPRRSFKVQNAVGLRRPESLVSTARARRANVHTTPLPNSRSLGARPAEWQSGFSLDRCASLFLCTCKRFVVVVVVVGNGVSHRRHPLAWSLVWCLA